MASENSEQVKTVMNSAGANAAEAARARELNRMAAKLKRFMDADGLDTDTVMEDLYAEIAGDDGKIS